MMFLLCIVYFVILALPLILVRVQVRGVPLVRLPSAWMWLVEPQNLMIGTAFVGFAVNVVLLSKFLPTSVGRACVVVIFKWVMASAIALALAGVVHIRKTPGLLPQRGRVHALVERTTSIAI